MCARVYVRAQNIYQVKYMRIEDRPTKEIGLESFLETRQTKLGFSLRHLLFRFVEFMDAHIMFGVAITYLAIAEIRNLLSI